jgi:1-acyl-sn-glycerol-3-phosphate acyltransferase
MENRGLINILLYRFSAFIIRLILKINGGLKIIGTENVPNTGGIIIASNHISYLDPLILGAISPRQVTFMARKGLFTMPLIGAFVKQYAFPVDREKPQPSTIKQAVKHIRSGEVITIFPEGRRNETGDFLQAKRGLGMIACMTQAPVVPVLIIGSDRALPVGARWLKRAKVTVIFDKPVYHGNTIDTSKKHDHALHEKISKNVMDAIIQLSSHYGNNNS